MKLNIEVTSETTPFEFSVLSDLFRKLSGAETTVLPLGTLGTASVAVVDAPRVPDEPEVKAEALVAPEPETKPATTRRRRTKAEIEADTAAEEAAKVAAAEAEAHLSNQAELGAAEAVAVDTATGEITSSAALGDEVVDVITQDVNDSADKKAFTEGEVQALATLIARSKGPDVVRNKIAELGGSRISALTAKQINELGAFLESQK